MSFWAKTGSKLNESTSTQGGLYFLPGNYLVKIARCKMIKTLANKEAFIAEFKVIASDVDKLGAGTEPSFFVDMEGKFPDLALGNVADFFRAGLASYARAAGHDVPSVEEIPLDEDTADRITGAANILAGTLLQVYAFNKPTKAGKDFTRMSWRVPDDVAKLAVEYATV